MTREERALWQKAADDTEGIISLLYSTLKFAVEIKMPPDNMKGLQEAINNVESFRHEVQSDLQRDKEHKGG
jgi:hypothetical protein